MNGRKERLGKNVMVAASASAVLGPFERRVRCVVLEK
jgi:hypothetical protein